MIIRKAIKTLLLAAGLCAVSAAPQISVDNATYKGGTVIEGRDTVVNAVFKVTNTGDAPLIISSVRVSCGCTAAKYDTTINPGKTGTVGAVLNLKGMRTGYQSRGITVMSNAANNGSLPLTIEATIQPSIEVSEGHLSFAGGVKKTLSLSSQKNDLKISGVLFKPSAGGNTQQWASDVPLNVVYKFAPSDSVRADGLKTYRLELDSPSGKERIAGEIRITTNHPHKREIVISVD